MKHTLKIGITLVVVAALAMSGIALAAQTSDDDTADVTDAPAYSRILEQLAPLVEDGTIDDTQAAAVAKHLVGSFREPGRGHVRAFMGLVAVADFLGLDGAEMREALGEYDTIAEIAEANGSSADEVIAHLVELTGQRLDLGVENGRITEVEKAALLENAEERITKSVNSPLPEPGERRPFRGRGPGGRRFGPGPGA
ncbi:MAG: hypothetical protein WD184_02920 [Acidimicrobiia bacterium]